MKMRLKREDGSTLTGDVAVAAHAGMLFVCGGTHDLSCGEHTPGLDIIERYDIAKGMWGMLPSMLEKRVGCIAVVLGGQLHVCGGAHNGHHLSSFERFDVGSNSWVTLPAMSIPRAYAGGVVARRFLQGPAEKHDAREVSDDDGVSSLMSIGTEDMSDGTEDEHSLSDGTEDEYGN